MSILCRTLGIECRRYTALFDDPSSHSKCQLCIHHNVQMKYIAHAQVQCLCRERVLDMVRTEEGAHWYRIRPRLAPRQHLYRRPARHALPTLTPHRPRTLLWCSQRFCRPQPQFVILALRRERRSPRYTLRADRGRSLSRARGLKQLLLFGRSRCVCSGVARSHVD